MTKFHPRPMLLALTALALLLTVFLRSEASAAPQPFPSASSTVVASVGQINADEIGYFWSAARGDRVTETFNSCASADGLTLDVEVVTNVLVSGASVDWDVEVNGNVVDSFTVDDGFTGAIQRVAAFAPIAGPAYEVTLRVTNEVPSGDGSHTFAYAGSYAHSIEFSCAEKVAVCHATASATNPYVLIEIDESAVPAHLDNPGHNKKSGNPDFLASPDGEGGFTCEDPDGQGES